MDPVAEKSAGDLELEFKNSAMELLRKLKEKGFEGEGTPIKKTPVERKSRSEHAGERSTSVESAPHKSIRKAAKQNRGARKESGPRSKANKDAEVHKEDARIGRKKRCTREFFAKTAMRRRKNPAAQGGLLPKKGVPAKPGKQATSVRRREHKAKSGVEKRKRP